MKRKKERKKNIYKRLENRYFIGFVRGISYLIFFSFFSLLYYYFLVLYQLLAGFNLNIKQFRELENCLVEGAITKSPDNSSDRII